MSITRGPGDECVVCSRQTPYDATTTRVTAAAIAGARQWDGVFRSIQYIARAAFGSMVQKLTIHGPPRSATWHITNAGDCVDPRGNQGKPEATLHRSHSHATQT